MARMMYFIGGLPMAWWEDYTASLFRLGISCSSPPSASFEPLLLPDAAKAISMCRPSINKQPLLSGQLTVPSAIPPPMAYKDGPVI